MIGKGEAKIGSASADAGWNDITGEAFREYVFPNGVYRIDNPVKVKIKRKAEGDSHRVISREIPDTPGGLGKPTSHYIPAGWIAIRWEGVDGEEEMSW